jgi:hypothetical protein
MGFDPQWYTEHAEEPKSNVSLDGITLEQMDGIVENAAVSNQERTAAAISKADYHSFLRANSWYKPTIANNKVVNRWLLSKGLPHPMYAEISDATTELAQAGLLGDVDEAAFAQHLDNATPKKFTGTFTKREYTDLDTMLLQERQAVIEQQGAEKQTDIERAFAALPLEDQQKMLTESLNTHQAKADGVITQQNADAWVSITPEYRDDEKNARLLTLTLKRMGVTGVATIEQLEIANRQLVASGLLRQNPKALEKQQQQEILDRGKRAVETPGGPWDTTTEEEMENLPLEEIRRRADLQLASRR